MSGNQFAQKKDLITTSGKTHRHPTRTHLDSHLFVDVNAQSRIEQKLKIKKWCKTGTTRKKSTGDEYIRPFWGTVCGGILDEEWIPPGLRGGT